MNKVSDPNEITAELACRIVRQALQSFSKLTYVIVTWHCGSLWPGKPESGCCEGLVLMWQIGKMVLDHSTGQHMHAERQKSSRTTHGSASVGKQHTRADNTLFMGYPKATCQQRLSWKDCCECCLHVPVVHTNDFNSRACGHAHHCSHGTLSLHTLSI